VEGVVVVGCSRKVPTTLENKHKQLVFEGGNGGGVLRAYDMTFEGGGHVVDGRQWWLCRVMSHAYDTTFEDGGVS